MLLTLTTTHSPATDLGFLLHKNPARPQSVGLSFGTAQVFYTEATPERCTVALLVEVDPVGLVRTRRGTAGNGGALQQYVNDQPEARKPLVEIAREFHCLPVALVLDLPERLAAERNKSRPDRSFGPHVIRQQSQQLHRSLRGLQREGFRHVHVLGSLEEIEAAVIGRQPLWNNLKHEHGPFDLIGDVHGCLSVSTVN